MRRSQRLRSADDFQRVRSEGRAWSHRLVVLLAAPSPVSPSTTRIGISVGRRIGGAVIRNRLKRQVREALRRQYDLLEPGWDLVLIVRPAARGEAFQAIEASVAAVLGRARLLRADA